MIRNVMKKTAMAAAVATTLASGQAFAAITETGGSTADSMLLGQQTAVTLSSLVITGSAANELAVAGELTSVIAGNGDFTVANTQSNPVTVTVTRSGSDVTNAAIDTISYAAGTITITWLAASQAGDILTVAGLDVVNDDADGLGAAATDVVAITTDLAAAGAATAVASATVASVSQAQAATISLTRDTAAVILGNGAATEQVDLGVLAASSTAFPQNLAVALKNGADPTGADNTEYEQTDIAAGDVAISSFATAPLANLATEPEVVAISWTQTGAATVVVTALDSDAATTQVDGVTANALLDGIQSLTVTADASTVVTLTASLDNGQTATTDIEFAALGVATTMTITNGYFADNNAEGITLADANGLAVTWGAGEITLAPVDSDDSTKANFAAPGEVAGTSLELDATDPTSPEVIPMTATYTKGGVTIANNVDYVIGTTANAKVVAHSLGNGSGFWTGVGLTNDSALSTSNYQMIGRSAAGAYVAASVGTIAKSGKVAVTADTAFGANANDVAYIDLTSAQTGDAFQLFGQYAGVDSAAATNLAGVSVGAENAAGTYTLAHFDSSSSFWTGIAIANGSTAQTATVTLTGTDGVAIGSQTVTLAASAKSLFTLEGLFGSVQGTGSLTITTTQNAAFVALIGNDEGSALSGLDLQ